VGREVDEIDFEGCRFGLTLRRFQDEESERV
jgi:hypothetical protein